jgi:bifunctional non-homologous end joining protein LigD
VELRVFIKPQLATLYDGFPPGKWIYEVKFDGYRMQANRKDGKSHFYTRSGLDWLGKFSFIEDSLAKLPLDIIIDGEVVSVEPSGRTNFSQLQADIKFDRQDRMTYYAFDLLRLGNQDLRPLPLLERKAALLKVLKKAKAPAIIYSEHHTSFVKELFAGACKMGLEGLIAKRPDAPYRSSRNENWLKLKCIQTEQFIIVGYVPSGTGHGIGALRLANRDLTYAGKVGTGFTDKVSLALREQLDEMSVPKAPIKMPKKKNTQWVEPKLIAKIAYRDITNDGLLRHASFKGLA